MMDEIKFNVMQNMIVINEFRQHREIIDNRDGPVVAHNCVTACFKYWYNSSFFPCSRKILLCQAQVENMPKNRNKISERPFMIKPGISSSPTDLEGFSLLMALQTSASEMGAKNKNSEN
jgi:hypothetical protein